MTQDPPFRKIFDGVVTREQMFELFNLVPDGPAEEIASGKAYANQWFEIRESEFELMFDRLPPLFLRAGMFAMSELKAGSIGLVFFDITIYGRSRWFTGYCDLGARSSPDAMRTAIIEHERAAVANLSRGDALDVIWEREGDDFRGLAGQFNPDAWPAEHHGKRTILVYEPGVGTVLKLLENLTDDEIADRLQHGPTI
ncbi:DUF1419 domain-containing protein [Sphingobium sp. V4]|uniref:DUF1419 domain-containing protein n=1 Tax=Sphingobium sp. V4 TaxID=3038927 RepID=UPI002557E4C3|nr:DUF1419 domain-containing protein [Sphingobium sp. V4]WIW89619.1 DUF1419 domain-containing protein [Sphingobium sp. V4]